MEKTKKKSGKKILAIILFSLIAIFILLMVLVNSAEKAIPDYTVSSSSAYVRDGKECMAYRVVTDSNISDDYLKIIFNKVTDDKYYLHTVWFYASNQDVNNNVTFATVEELTKDNPQIKK